MTGFSTSKLFQLFQDYFWRLKWPFSCSSSITVLQNSVLKIVSLSIFQVQFKYRPRIAWEIGDSQRHLSRGNSTRVEKGIHLTILFFTLVTFLSLRKSPKYVFRVRIFQITFGAKIQIYLLCKEALLAPLAMLKNETFCSYFQTLCCFFFKGMLSSTFCWSSLPEKR